MNSQHIPRIMIAATASGSGKTTITCGLLQALVNRQMKVASFKCGPDYIDPMFHSEVIGIRSRNLDLFFNDEDTTRYLLAKNSQVGQLAVIEGVMGYFDGVAGKTTIASSYELAKVTKTPVVLVINCKGMSLSVVAQIKGFIEYRKDHPIAGVILNQVSPMIYGELKELIEEELSIAVLGYVPKLSGCFLESRHLGLVTAQEVEGLKEKLQMMAEQIEKSVDIEGLLAIANGAEPVNYQSPVIPTINVNEPISIGIAKDKAFCFYYQDSLDLLTEMGAKFIPFSPLEDTKLPEGIQGLMIGGGYPELYGKQLAANTSMLHSIKEAIDSGIPCWAECGGFMYLHEGMEDGEQVMHPMVGAIEGTCHKTDKLQRFGYIQLTLQQDTLLGKAGQQINGHEFHYWDSTHSGEACLAKKPLRKRNWLCIHGNENLFAGYPHIHLYSNVEFGKNFLTQAVRYKKKTRS